LIWSVSAHRTWSRCQRQFFFDQFVANARAKDTIRQRARFLDAIQQWNWWTGHIVHKAIEKWILPPIKAGQWPHGSAVIKQAQNLARQQFLFSQSGEFRKVSKAEAGDIYCVLAPHYFEKPLEPDALDKAQATIAEALQHLLNSQVMRNFLMGRQWYNWEYYLDFEIDGTRARAVPDLLMPSKGGPGLDVVDWKVATSASRYHFQIAVYALAAQATGWLAARAKAGVAGYVINLLVAEPGVALESPYQVDEDILAATENEIYESIEGIHALIGGKKYDELEIEQFEYANSAGTCAFCNWRELCVELSDEPFAKPLSDLQPKPTQLGLPLG
jgi:hypothetical protein